MGRILLVEDHPFNAEAMQRLLSRKGGHEVRVAHDGPQALVMAVEWKPDLALLDIGLPGMNGLDVAKHLRANPATNSIILVALTASVDSADHRAALAGLCGGGDKAAGVGACVGVAGAVAQLRKVKNTAPTRQNPAHR